ncbi:MAG: aromatic ring-hydroxylating dioxygenase subunit alpha, partial [Rhodospirillaceae bacterium]|nr:aromatic ring-hydroxylating dioxygenase subunit alpha [Rhodospirillaceae bacterium]
MNVDVTRNILTDEVLSRFDLATEEATGLPNACYTSKEWLKDENTRLFAKTWMLAGFCHDIPGKGDACPVDLAGMPLV